MPCLILPDYSGTPPRNWDKGQIDGTKKSSFKLRNQKNILQKAIFNNRMFSKIVFLIFD